MADDALAWHRELEAEYAARLAEWSDIAEQMPLLYAAARGYARPVIAELGTRTGQSTAALLAGASASGGHVWSVDCGPVTVPSWWITTGLWSFLPADDLSDEAARWLPAELDILFIDTSHLYERTLDELHWYAPRVRPGGTVFCHDPELRRDDPVMDDPVTGDQWLRAAAAGPEYPVAAALDTYCAETGLTWERQVQQHTPVAYQPFYGLGTIRIPVARSAIDACQEAPDEIHYLAGD